MLKPSSLAPPRTGRSRFSKALPELPPIEPFEPFSAVTGSPPAQRHATKTSNPPTLPPVSSPKSTALPPLPVPEETYVRPRMPPLPPQPQQQPQVHAAPEPANPSPQHKPAPPAVPPMSIPRRPVAKPAATPQPPPEPASPSGSLSSLLSAYSRSSGESLIRSSDGGDGTGNSSSAAAFSPEESAMNGFPLPPRSAPFVPNDSKPAQESAANPKTAFPLPPRTASLAPKDSQPLTTRNGFILPSSKTVPPPPPTKDEGRPPDVQRECPATPANKTIPPPPATQNGPIQPGIKTVPPPPPAKDEERPQDARREGSSEAPGPAPASAAPEPGMRSRSSSQATSELWVRRTARSNHSHDAPELKLTISRDRPAEDSQVLPQPFRPSAPTAQNSPARPLQPVYAAYTPTDVKSQSPLPALPSQPAEASQQAGEKMGQRSSRVKEKLQAIRGGVSKHLKGSPSQGEAVISSPLSQQLTPGSRGAGGESASVSPLGSEIQPGEEQGHVTVQQMQAQQQQRLHQRAPSHQKPIGSSTLGTLHAARSLPDMKAPVSQTSSERPPPIASEYVHPQDSPVPPQTLRPPPISSEYAHPQDSPVPSQTPQEQSPVEQKFPPRTSSTRAPPPLAQKQQQFPERGRPRAGSAATFDGRAPSMDRRVGRVSSNASLVDYAPPPPRTRASDTVYREANQDDLPPPDPRAMYFPQQTSRPAPAGTVFRAPEVRDAHRSCFQRHAKMIMARNRHYPLACMACGVGDAELRWQCAFCRLRVCGGCVRLLQGFERDLGRVLEHIAARDGGDGAEGDEVREGRGSGVVEGNVSRPGSRGLEKVREARAEAVGARPV